MFFVFVLSLAISGPIFILIGQVARIYHAHAEEARQLKAERDMNKFKSDMQSIRGDLKKANDMIQVSKDLRDIETELRYKQLEAESNKQ